MKPTKTKNPQFVSYPENPLYNPETLEKSIRHKQRKSKYTPEEKAERKRQAAKAWYQKNREEHKKACLERYHEQKEFFTSQKPEEILNLIKKGSFLTKM